MNIVCISHLRWDFVLQRPQHLLNRAAQEGRVLYVEEPMWGDWAPHMDVTSRSGGVLVAVPHLPERLRPEESLEIQRGLLDTTVSTHVGDEFTLWYYTPMGLPFSDHLAAASVVYDCMDELSAFAGAPAALKTSEAELFRIADVVFTGGHSLYEAKRRRHPRVFAFPSSVDVGHFSRARRISRDPSDQADIPHARLGFFGVIDERMDYDLLAGVAAARPDWHLVLIGPTAKVDPAALPRAANIHYLGPKSYAELPEYIAGWDVALLPFARNEATRFISPTKTPEYLAAGKPVVSTSIRDVVRPYGERGLVHIADSVDAFVAASAACLAGESVARLEAVDAFLAHLSWDSTWQQMRRAITQAMKSRPRVAAGGAQPLGV
jgi:glycosyltransferase involved in cell wall biosynthesis